LGHDGPEHGLDERFRRALDSILDLVVVERAVRNAQGEIIDFEIEWMNNAPVDVAGRPRDQLIGHRISELYPVLAGGELIAGYRQVVETGEPLVVPVLRYEDVIDGRSVSGFYAVQATRFEDGVLVASRDITPWETSRRDLEIVLRELEAAQRLARLGTWRVDLQAGTAELSGELQRTFDLPAGANGELEINGLADMIHPDDRAAVNDAHQRAMRTRNSIVIEHRVLRGDGKVAHVRTYAEPLLVADEVVGIWGTTQDISDAIADRDALLAEHVRRVSAETLAELASTLNGVTSAQEIADATLRTMEPFAEVAVVVLALVEVNEPVLHQYYAGPGLPGDVQARYLRTPLAVDTHMTRVVTQQQPLFLRDREAQMAEFPNIMTDVHRTGLQSVAALPLRRASGSVLGALAIGWSQPRDYDAESSATLLEVAEVIGRTAERLELLDLERSVAETLQLGLLALDLRSTTAIVRARYRASDATMEVGGDWYDAIELSGGRVAVAVGDVVGRGLPAAATMGQLRAALGVTALQAEDAAAAIEMLDKYANHVPGAKCATVAFAIADTSTQTVTYACAGHPPPLLVTPGGETKYLEGGRSWPLGVDFVRSRPAAATEHLPPGSLLLLYTDGLVERSGESIDVGLDRLRRVVAGHWNLPLRRLKQAIFRELIDISTTAATDDIALVALRTTGSSHSHFVDAIHADPAEATATRHRLRAWLDDLRVEGEALDSLLLAVGEAVANAIDHGSRRDSSQIVKIELAANDGDITAAISDSGHWQPGIAGYFTGRGRGHLLMQALTEAVNIDTDQQGTIVMLQFSRTPASV